MQQLSPLHYFSTTSSSRRAEQPVGCRDRKEEELERHKRSDSTDYCRSDRIIFSPAKAQCSSFIIRGLLKETFVFLNRVSLSIFIMLRKSSELLKGDREVLLLDLDHGAEVQTTDRYGSVQNGSFIPLRYVRTVVLVISSLSRWLCVHSQQDRECNSTAAAAVSPH